MVTGGALSRLSVPVVPVALCTVTGLQSPNRHGVTAQRPV